MWLICIFLKTTEASNLEIYTKVVPEGLYILTENSVTNYYGSPKITQICRFGVMFQSGFRKS